MKNKDLSQIKTYEDLLAAQKSVKAKLDKSRENFSQSTSLLSPSKAISNAIPSLAVSPRIGVAEIALAAITVLGRRIITRRTKAKSKKIAKKTA